MLIEDVIQTVNKREKECLYLTTDEMIGILEAKDNMSAIGIKSAIDEVSVMLTTFQGIVYSPLRLFIVSNRSSALG